MDIVTLAKEIIKLSDDDLVLLNEKINLFNLSLIDVLKKEIKITKEEIIEQLLFGLKENGFDKDNCFIKDGKKLLWFYPRNGELFISNTHIWAILEEEYDDYFNNNYNLINSWIRKYVLNTLGIEMIYSQKYKD